MALDQSNGFNVLAPRRCAPSTANVFSTKFGRCASPRPGPLPGSDGSVSASSLKAVMPVSVRRDRDRVGVLVRRVVDEQHRLVVEHLVRRAFGRVEVSDLEHVRLRRILERRAAAAASQCGGLLSQLSRSAPTIRSSIFVKSLLAAASRFASSASSAASSTGRGTGSSPAPSGLSRSASIAVLLKNAKSW